MSDIIFTTNEDLADRMNRWELESTLADLCDGFDLDADLAELDGVE